MNSSVKFSCEFLGQAFQWKNWYSILVSVKVIFLQKAKDLEIAPGQNLFLRCSFFCSERILKVVGQR